MYLRMYKFYFVLFVIGKRGWPNYPKIHSAQSIESCECSVTPIARPIHNSWRRRGVKILEIPGKQPPWESFFAIQLYVIQFVIIISNLFPAQSIEGCQCSVSNGRTIAGEGEVSKYWKFLEINHPVCHPEDR